MKNGAFLVLSVVLAITNNCRADDQAPIEEKPHESLQGVEIEAANREPDQTLSERENIFTEPFYILSDSPEEAYQQAIYHIGRDTYGQEPLLPPLPYLLPPYRYYSQGYDYPPFHHNHPQAHHNHHHQHSGQDQQLPNQEQAGPVETANADGADQQQVLIDPVEPANVAEVNQQEGSTEPIAVNGSNDLNAPKVAEKPIESN